MRLIGVRGEQLVGAVARLGLWDDDEAWRDTESAVDAVTTKFGAGALRPAALLREDQRRRYGHGDDYVLEREAAYRPRCHPPVTSIK